MPDFANPSGVSMSEATRRRLLDVAWQENLLLLEDNPYGLFHGDHERVPTLKALDEHRTVVYLGSYAKSALPGARIGYVIADQRVTGGDGLFADELSKIKSMLTVNTPAIAQAVVGGKLVANDCALAEVNAPARRLYARNMNQILTGLARRLPPDSGVTWNSPTGGFFAVVTVPFTVDDTLLEYSARTHRVLWTPMSHFYDGPGGGHALRLSASLVTGDEIDEGLDRLATLITELA
jgi:(S)-3,5-dihydroxyphenylglycine transaminase